jgi:nitrite reductase/ring-hydroxylating ferredoxin subunit
MSEPQHSCNSNSKEVRTSVAAISRRNFFAGVAIAAGSLGLSSIASSAEAASKKYKVCSIKDVKVGGGSIFKLSAAGGIQILITQPKAGVFRAFNPACTHQGFRLGSISGSNIVCPIHRATFDTTTGKVTRGPAQVPLQKYTLTVENNSLFVALSS